MVHQAAPSTSSEIRVFVSSTFRDMQAEREELVKRVFPQLRRLCEERGATFTEVDLRWGVTEQQARRGEVLPLCLAEIDRCTHFIGLVGQRYGWIPPEIPPELMARFPDLRDLEGRSLTELEVVHGVLRHRDQSGRARCYLREPAFLDNLPQDEQSDLVDAEPAVATRLESLRHWIRENGVPVRGYSDPHALGHMILEDLGAEIQRLFPDGRPPAVLDRQLAEHHAFASKRTRIYVGGDKYCRQLDAFAEGTADGPGIVIVGPSGSGKSALLANWAAVYRESHPADRLIAHFIGSTPDSGDWAIMLRRLLAELRRQFDIDEEIPSHGRALRSAFANWLYLTAARGRVVLIIDALDQLEDKDGAADLVWLPAEIPGNVRLLVSTLPGRPLAELTKRRWPQLSVTPLTRTEREDLITRYLAQYAKSLDTERRRRIVAAAATGNALYLNALLEELRLFGTHELLDQHLDRYLAASTVDGLFERILQRYESDYEQERPGLVAEAMSLLYAARHGLAEAELLDLLGAEGEALPHALWSPLYLAAEPSLVSRSGLLGFFHDHLRQAVRSRYLTTPDMERGIRERLVSYFEGRDLSPRKLDELPWQLARSGALGRLEEMLADLTFFRAACEHEPFDLRSYWTQIESAAAGALPRAYAQVLQSPEDHTDSVWNLATLLTDLSYPAEALRLRRFIVERYRKIGDLRNLSGALGNVALLLVQDRPDEALALFREQEGICRAIDHVEGLVASLGNQTLALQRQGKVEAALSLLEEQERLCREYGFDAELAASRCEHANVFYVLGRYDEALALLDEEQKLCRQTGDLDRLSMGLNNEGRILVELSRLKEAAARLDEAERIAVQIGNKTTRAGVLLNRAKMLSGLRQTASALVTLALAEALARDLQDRDLLQGILGLRGHLQLEQGEPEPALATLRERERLCRVTGNQRGLAEALGGMATVLYASGDLDGAIRGWSQQEEISRRLGYKDGIQAALNNLALVHTDRADFERALQLLDEQEELSRSLGTPSSQAKSLNNRARIMLQLGRLDEAKSHLEKQEQISRRWELWEDLERSLILQAMVAKQKGLLDRAMRLLDEDEEICRRFDLHRSLQGNFSVRGNVFFAARQHADALRAFQEQERVCRALGDKDLLQHSLWSQALCHQALGNRSEEMRLYRAQAELCREIGNWEYLHRSLCNQALHHYEGGHTSEAIDLFREDVEACRKLGHPEELVKSLGTMANLLAEDAGQPAQALPLMEEAYEVAVQHGYVALSDQLAPRLESLRRRQGPS